MKKLTFALVAAACATSAMAEITIGTVNGLVTATSGNQLVNVTPGMKFPDGTQINVPAGANVQISMPGCSALVNGLASVSMTQANCKVIAEAGGGTGGGGLSPWVYGAGGAGLLAWNINRNRNNNNNGATVTPPVTPTTPTQPATPAVVVTPTPTPRPSNS